MAFDGGQWIRTNESAPPTSTALPRNMRESAEDGNLVGRGPEAWATLVVGQC